MIRRSLVITVVLLALGFFTPKIGAQQNETNDITLSAVERAWRDRQDRIKTVQVEWDESRFFAQGSYPNLGNEKDKNPPQDVTVDVKGLLFKLDEQSRIFTETEAWNPSSSDSTSRDRYRSSFNGEISADCMDPGTLSYSLGTIFDSPRYKEVRSSVIRPLLLAYRPLAEGTLHIDLESFEILPDKVRVGEVDCVVLQQLDDGRGRVRESYLLDPERDFLLIRFFETVNEEPRFQTDIDYKEDPEHGWVPYRWKSIFMKGQGRVVSSQVATVTQFALNTPISEEEFEIRFPPNTWVRDSRADKQYIIRPDGTKRPITKSELLGPVLTFEQLVSSEPDEGMRSTAQRSRWLIFANVLLIAALLFFVYFRRRVNA